MDIVKIHNKYAIRKRVLFFYSYKDLTGDFWWSRSSPCFKYCLSDDINLVKEKYLFLTAKDEIIYPEKTEG